jgi:hypothetical protein
MREYKIRNDLERAVIDGFALPLGIQPIQLPSPTQGYTLDFNEGEDGEPDTFSFHVVTSHDRMTGLVREALGLLPDEVTPIVEVGSRDAYRSVDVFMGREPISFEAFLEVWEGFEPVFMEDASIGVGASSAEPLVEVFLDSWKGLMIHVTPERREAVERMLRRHSLREVEETWPESLDEVNEPPSQVRDVLAIEDDQSPDLDEVLLQVRECWGLELDVDDDANLDDAGRELGATLWHSIAVCMDLTSDGNLEHPTGAYITFWLTARNVAEVRELVTERLKQDRRWLLQSFYTLDRVAFDERPEALDHLPMQGRKPEVHLVEVDPW